MNTTRFQPEILPQKQQRIVFTPGPTTIKGVFVYLYLFMDVYSRKIVGWQIYECESSAWAADVMRDIAQREGLQTHQVTLHSDNGGPMKGATLLATLQTLGIAPSYSRPSVSNDNPYSEALFKTLKYRPNYPIRPFTGLSDARLWVAEFVHWYNYQHRHSAINFVTPEQRHTGQDKAILTRRQSVFEAVKQRHPSRWRGNTRNWTYQAVVHLNPNHDGKIDAKE